MNTLPPGTVIRTVSEFTSGLARWFKNQTAFRGAAISGEISGLKEISGGHVTFALKDRGGVLNCIVWQSRLRAMPPLRNGTAVVAVGNVELRGEYSSYQMVVDGVQLTGIGDLFAKFEALKEQFRVEGLFAPERKRHVPAFVRSVALISAPGSKASEDFLSTIRSKVPFVEVALIPTRVQGEGAQVDIREAFDRADRMDVDVVVLTRGGGSYEDLFTFNEEVVVRAIVRSRHPVITAIGHQEDHHLADDVADAVYGTPSKAAEAIAQAWLDIRERIGRANRDLIRAMETAVGTKSQTIALKGNALEGLARARVAGADRTLVNLERRLNAQNPLQRLAGASERLARQRAKLDLFPSRLTRTQAGFESRATRLDPAWLRLRQALIHELRIAENHLDRLDPNEPLARGYAMIFRDGVLVRSAGDVDRGERIVARLGHGTLEARVEATHDE
jgi:exodeoxyribonuclease VII large subunit